MIKKISYSVLALVSFYGVFLYIATISATAGWWSPPTLFVIIAVFLLSFIKAVMEIFG